MMNRLRDFAHWLSPYIERFGFVRGTRIGLAIRRLDYAGVSGTLVSVPVPGGPALVGRARTHDGAVIRQIYLWRELEADFPGAVRTIVDAGANIGVSARYLAQRFPGARIVCLEVDRGNVELLSRNVGSVPGAQVRSQALWGRRARVAIENPTAATDGYRCIERADGPIDAVGLADLLDELGLETLDLLKLDIEGAELEVFTREPERWLPRVRMIMVELHDRYRPGCTQAMNDIVRAGGYALSQSGEYFLLARA